MKKILIIGYITDSYEAFSKRNSKSFEKNKQPRSKNFKTFK